MQTPTTAPFGEWSTSEDSAEAGYCRPFGQIVPADRPVSANWTEAVRSTLDRFRLDAIERQCEQLASVVEKQRAEIAALRNECEALSKNATSVSISTFAPEPYDIVLPISVVIQRDGDAFTASFVEANINASGDSGHEALEMVKDMILMAYDRLSSKADKELGPAPLKQKRVLMSVLKEKS